MISSVLAFVLTLAVLVVVHEYGHYRVAVACGVKVLRFSVGFGRVLWRHQRTPDSTEFVLSAWPLGGYVRMLDEREGPVDPAEQHRAFNRRPLLQRAAVVAAGPLANFLLAMLLFAAASWIGQDEPKALLGAPRAGSIAEAAGMRAGDWVQAWSWDGNAWNDVASLPELREQLAEAMATQRVLHLLVSDAEGRGRHPVRLDTERLGSPDLDAQTWVRLGLGAAFSEPVLGRVMPEGPGAQAGLQSGDHVLAVDGEPVSDAGALRDRIRAALDHGVGRSMSWRVLRKGQERTLDVRPRAAEDAGQAVGRIDVMIGGQPQMVSVSHGLTVSLQMGVERTWSNATLTLQVFGRMLVGQASLKNLSGPITIADYAGQSARTGIAPFLNFLAYVSVSLGVLNLLPLPMLDGGHLIYYLFEGLSGRPVSDWWLKQLQRAGAMLMLLLMALALSNDLTRLLGPH
ncbi:MAG: RIP metalloprotease RseP [Burkholderiaceae bacterium]|nr:RIP metalloprotease RseP [Roseateles sp.]MBV8469778.1 RIP metalloprotease RseP [Burkholderiaceae bacterium]